MAALVSVETFVPIDGHPAVFTVQPSSGTLENCANLIPPIDIYYYHGDRLGSANWITDVNGDAISNDLNKE